MINAWIVPNQIVICARNLAFLTRLAAPRGFRSHVLHQQYDVAPDGQRFVMIRNPRAEEGELIVVENFFEELKAKVGN